MPAQRFDVLFIDFYGTIAAGDREAVDAACRTVVKACGLPVTPEEFAVLWGERFFEVLSRSNHEAFRTLHECEMSSLLDALTPFGCEPDPAPLVVELENYWRDPPLHSDVLEALKQVDIPVCCVSNADTKPLLRAIEERGLRFDGVISSEQARCYKPDPKIFCQALKLFDIPPSRAIHVGDSVHSDVGGAENAGIASVWLHRNNRIHDIGRSDPWRTIQSLTELDQLLH